MVSFLRASSDLAVGLAPLFICRFKAGEASAPLVGDDMVLVGEACFFSEFVFLISSDDDGFVEVRGARV